MHIYPELLPIDALNVVFSAALHPTVKPDAKKLTAAGYQLLGYVLGQTVGEPTALVGQADPAVMLASLLAQAQNNQSLVQGKVSDRWMLFLQYAIMFATAWLAQQNQPKPPTP